MLDFGQILLPLDWRAKVMAVTDADVQAVAREVFLNQSHATAEIGEA